MGTSETKEHGENLRYQLVYIIALYICGRLILGPLQILKSLDAQVFFYIKGICRTYVHLPYTLIMSTLYIMLDAI